MNSHNSKYTYKDFLGDVEILENTELQKTKIQRCKCKITGSEYVKYSSAKYYNTDITENLDDNSNDECFIFDFSIIYSESFNSPIVYFNISLIPGGKIISFDEYKQFILTKYSTNDIERISSSNCFHISNKSTIFEVEKTNCPLTGSVKWSMYLCNFYSFLNSINTKNHELSKNNILLLFISLINSYLDIK